MTKLPLGKVIGAGAAVFVLLQLVRPSIPVESATAEVQAPPEIRRILEKGCYSCHSNQRRLSWFDQIVPAYWLVRHDILMAREHLNFATLGSAPAATQKAVLYEAVNMVRFGEMPLRSFAALHPEARLTPRELAALEGYLAPWSTPPDGPAAAGESPSHPSLTQVHPAPNGLPFDPAFANWKPISTTDRGDNSTFRLILGNDLAVKAVQSGSISPWPDGARLAKIAWQQELGPDGLVHPGKFVQVELMVKDAQRYKATEGWGWGRWRGLDLTPYGKDAKFVNECTECHQPMRGNDFVYTLAVSRNGPNDAVNRAAAALPDGLPYRPLDWSAITMYVDRKTRTMATLYGNDAAMRRGPSYAEGAVLALVTWAQRDDPHWFGARIPDVPRSVEFVQVAAGGQLVYRRFAGAKLTGDSVESDAAAQRAKFVVGLPPARLP